LSEIDVIAAPVFHAISRLFHLGRKADDVAQGGTSWINAHIETEMSFFRNWDAMHVGDL
jgi:hypothetical protein